MHSDVDFEEIPSVVPDERYVLLGYTHTIFGLDLIVKNLTMQGFECLSFQFISFGPDRMQPTVYIKKESLNNALQFLHDLDVMDFIITTKHHDQ